MNNQLNEGTGYYIATDDRNEIFWILIFSLGLLSFVFFYEYFYINAISIMFFIFFLLFLIINFFGHKIIVTKEKIILKRPFAYKEIVYHMSDPNLKTKLKKHSLSITYKKNKTIKLLFFKNNFLEKNERKN